MQLFTTMEPTTRKGVVVQKGTLDMPHARRIRVFGRRYVVRWDHEVGRFHVTLGTESIGFHKDRDGAEALALAHCRYSTSLAGQPPAIVTIDADELHLAAT
jgi:hypothetical protein